MSAAVVGVFVPIVLFLVIGAIVVAAIIQGGRSRRAVQETVQKAIESGTPLTPEAITALGARPGKRDNLRTGLILLAIWAGFIALGLGVGFGEGDWDALGPLAGIGAFPGLIGVALIGLHVSRKDQS